MLNSAHCSIATDFMYGKGCKVATANNPNFVQKLNSIFIQLRKEIIARSEIRVCQNISEIWENSCWSAAMWTNEGLSHHQGALCQGLLCLAVQGQHIVPIKCCPSPTLNWLKESSVLVHSLDCGCALGKCLNLDVLRLLTPLICLTKMPKLVQDIWQNSSEKSGRQSGVIAGARWQHV